MKPKKNYHLDKSGFALIATISIMSLLIFVALAITSLAKKSTTTLSETGFRDRARANARLALGQAIAQLQTYAGPDQRATATASILDGQSINPQACNTTSPYSATGSSVTVSTDDNRSRWTGVWNTQSYIQATPNSKEFLQWLVSGATSDITESATDITPSTSAAFQNSFHIIFDRDPTDSSADSEDVIVPKVDILKNASTTGRYAYWTEDMGVKANMAWNEMSSSAPEIVRTAARMAVSPSINYDTFGGPLENARSTETTIDAYTDVEKKQMAQIKEIHGLSDMHFITGYADDDYRQWALDNRHDLDTASYGVLADMKLGGLKRDLSLAFEMDGTEENEGTQPTLFNQQYGELVGNSSTSDHDLLDGPELQLGFSNYPRYVYRDINDTVNGGVFSSAIDAITYGSHQGVARGPNWWCLRDYANLYKRLTGSSGDYHLAARSVYPDSSASSSFTYEKYTGLNRDYYPTVSQYNDNSQYVPHPARSSYTPLYMGSVGIFSINTDSSSGTRKLNFHIDPFFYIWNPYNIALDTQTMTIRLYDSFVGNLTFKIITQQDDPATTDINEEVYTQYGPSGIGNYVTGTHSSSQHTYLVESMLLDPGEVRIVSPRSARDLTKASQQYDYAEPGTNLTIDDSGLVVSKFPVFSGNYNDHDDDDDPATPDVPNIDDPIFDWVDIDLQDSDEIQYVYSRGLYTSSDAVDNASTWSSKDERMRVFISLPDQSSTLTALDMQTTANQGEQLQFHNTNVVFLGHNSIDEHVDNPSYHSATGESIPASDYSSAGDANTLDSSKFFIGGMSRLTRSMIDDRPDVSTPGMMELFQHFNPTPSIADVSIYRITDYNKMFTQIMSNGGSHSSVLQSLNLDLPTSSTDPDIDQKGYYGESYTSSGRTAFTAYNKITNRPLLSLVEFNGAQIALHPHEPHSPIGESFPNIFINPLSPYGQFEERAKSMGDSSWLINNALFDRYYLSGLAPEYTISSTGYSATNTLNDVIEKFYTDTESAFASPVITPYYPKDKSNQEIISALNSNDGSGYKKIGAYAMLEGMFNVNSTSVNAWKALLLANQNLAVDFINSSSSDNNSGTPYPKGVNPGIATDGNSIYDGFSRLTDGQIDALATEIVNQVKQRGPFMSLSDFINHRVGSSTVTDSHKAGAIQAALDASGIYDDIHGNDASTQTNYSSLLVSDFPDANHQNQNRQITTGLPGSITQANILLPIAPKLNARSDTFRITAYGEALDSNGNIIASATCEAVIQRFPEYVNHNNDSTISNSSTPDLNNKPWEEPMQNPLPMVVLNPKTDTTFNKVNQKLGRQFRVMSFRWLTEDEQ